jgi:hypothetical protein
MSWDQTPEGVAVNNAYINLHQTYTTYLPNFIAALAQLANRPITG